MEHYITVSEAARRHRLTQVQVWSLIRQKKLRTKIDTVQQVTVDVGQLDKYVKAHPQQIEAWQQPKRPEVAETKTKTKKSGFNYGKF